VQFPRRRKKFKEAMEADQRTYNEIADILFQKHYDEMVSGRMDDKKAKSAAEKKAIEDARYVFPNACETKVVLTMNARTLLHFFNKRCCERAQWEIRNMADLMLAEAKKVAPFIFKNAGPGCVYGPCPEGAMSCGKTALMREKYRNL